MQELKTAFGKLGVTATLPSSYWYTKGLDIKYLEHHVDLFNVMTYGLSSFFVNIIVMLIRYQISMGLGMEIIRKLQASFH